MRPVPIVPLCLIIGTLVGGGCSRAPLGGHSSGASHSQTSDNKIAMISIISDPGVDPQEVNMALTFAGFCVDEGYDANIFLNVKGVKLATSEFSDQASFQDHPPLKKQLIDLKERGVQVHVCPVCMKDFDINPSDIIPAAFVTDKPKLFAKLGADTMVFTY